MTASTSRLGRLRHLMKVLGADGFLVPRADAHQGEYVAPCDERLAWLTGFTGSAGMAVVLTEKAAVFVDGRYTLQAHDEVNTNDFEICALEDSYWNWIKKKITKGQTILYDPWLHTMNQKTQADHECEYIGASFVPAPYNLIDKIWEDRPEAPTNPIHLHGLAYAGVESKEKRQLIVETLQIYHADASLLSAPDSIAWLLNIRGNDIPHTPIAHGFAVLWADASVDLFMNQKKVSKEILESFGQDVRLKNIEEVEPWLENLKQKRVLIDPALTPLALIQKLDHAHLIKSQDPCALPKAQKNKAEIQGARDAHVLDGIAVTRFLSWLSKVSLTDQITELDASGKLLSFRKESALFKDTSFETISASGPNGAIVHYRVTPDTNRLLEKDSIYLVDSGGQYLNGTTDITRTVAICTPTPEQKDRFTRVLKGHIALATSLFPKGTTGSQLDSLARTPLWEAGLDYNHGTGHGVGSYLNVHEGPQRISKGFNNTPLFPGMIISNEPGYYKTGAYGIRIESLVVVVEKGTPPGGEHALLGFETLTQVPIDLALIEVKLLTPSEREWLNTYHKKVRENLLPSLNEEESSWLKQSTKEI